MAGVVITIKRTKTVDPRTIEFNEIFFMQSPNPEHVLVAGEC